MDRSAKPHYRPKTRQLELYNHLCKGGIVPTADEILKRQCLEAAEERYREAQVPEFWNTN